MGTVHTGLIPLIGMLVVCPSAGAWFEDGHRAVTELAIRLAGTNLPSFFMKGRTLAVVSVPDPDLFCARSFPMLRDQESPEHYINIERLGKAPLPSNRYACVALCAQRGIDPSDLGFLPYAVIEWTDRLTMAFAEHRKWPEDGNIQSKCLVYAGLLSHYAADLTQPLHVTVHFDGRLLPDGTSPRTGIHARVDGIVGRFKGVAVPKSIRLVACTNIWQTVQNSMARTAALVDRVYTLDSAIPPLDKPLPDDPGLASFVRERTNAAVGLTASLFVTAWIDSAAIEIPSWHRIPDPAR